MKTRRAIPLKKGFTLLELLVAMTITTIIVTVLVSITSIAIDTWNRSRSELRAARQAKAMVDSMAADFESLVVRTGNPNEWLSAKRQQSVGDSTNSTTLVFFTAATDRYNGQIGKAGDLGGDVSCVGYQLDWKDPIAGGSAANQTFVLNRYLVDPKPTFDNLLGKQEIGTLFVNNYGTQLAGQQNFICENVFQFTITFHVQVSTTTGTTTKIEEKLITMGSSGLTEELHIKGTGIETTPANTELKEGKVTAVGISLTVLSDAGVDLIRKSPGRASDAAWLAKNSFEYSKLIQLPGM